jgi:hypothetical protein
MVTGELVSSMDHLVYVPICTRRISQQLSNSVLSTIAGPWHFAIAADPVDFNTVYIGGSSTLQTGSFFGDRGGGSLKAKTASGRLFRGDFAARAWAPLTHTGTASGSSPHGDSRALVFDARTGRLVHTNDGGVYVRTQPRSAAGDWLALNGDLCNSEMVSASVDARTGAVVAGLHDNGGFVASSSTRVDAADYQSGFLSGAQVSPGDGGFTVANADSGTLIVTTQGLSRMFATNADGAGLYPFFQTTFASMNPFYPVLLANAVDPQTMMTCIRRPVMTAGCFTIQLRTVARPVQPQPTKFSAEYWSAFAFGGRRGGAADASVFLGINNATVYTESKSGGKVAVAAPFRWGACDYLSVNPTDYFEALMVCHTEGTVPNAIGAVEPGPSSVYATTDFGQTWQNITGDLYAVSGVRHSVKARSALVIPLPSTAGGMPVSAYLVGTWRGVFVAFSDAPAQWRRLGTHAEFPTVFVTRMQFEPVFRTAGADLLLVATLGRGIWAMGGVVDLLARMRAGAACPAPRPLPPAYARAPVDCVVAEWSPPSACSAACGGGVTVSRRAVAVAPANGGAACPPDAQLRRFAVCANVACPGARWAREGQDVLVDELDVSAWLIGCASGIFIQDFICCELP